MIFVKCAKERKAVKLHGLRHRNSDTSDLKQRVHVQNTRYAFYVEETTPLIRS